MRYIHEFILNKNNNIKISDKKYSFSKKELSERSNYLINFFLKKNVKKGFRTLIILPNSVFIPICITSISFVGGVFSIIEEKLSKNSLKKIEADYKPDFVITSKNYPHNFSKKINKIILENFINKKKKKIKNINFKRSIYDTVSVTYTSGSSGKIKGVVSNHKSVLFSTSKILEFLKYKNVKIGCFLPLSFDYGLYQVFLALKSNSDIYLGNSDELGINFIDILNKNKINCLPLVQNILINFLSLIKRYKRNFIKLKIITNTGSKISKTYLKDIKKIYENLKIYLMYGLTECKRVSILDYNRYPKKRNSVGLPLKSTKCWIVDKNKNKIFNKKGELVVEGKNVMEGYYRDEKLTSEKFLKINKNISRLYTGDICKIDRDGFVYFYERMDDIFKFKNYRISKREVENDLKELNFIKDAVVMKPKNKFKFTFFLKTNMRRSLLIRKIKQNLDFYKIAERIIILSKIPFNNRGKVDQKKLLSLK
mgnify:FL=1